MWWRSLHDCISTLAKIADRGHRRAAVKDFLERDVWPPVTRTGGLIVSSPVGGPYFEERLGVLTYGTDGGGLLSDVDVSAVAAFPHDDLVLLEDDTFLDVLE